jgi:ATP-binding cassette subfamily B protein
MRDKEAGRRDRAVTRYIHRLFWQGNVADARGLIICYVTRVPAMIIYNVLIPLVIAYGIQAIVTRDFGSVDTYAWLVMACALAYSVLWAIGGVTICQNAIAGCDYVQRKVFANYLYKDYEFYSNTYLGALGAQAVRMRDAFNEYNGLMVLHGPKQVVIVIAGVVIIGLQSVLLALVTLLCMSAVLSYTILSSRWRLRFRRKLSEASSELAGVIGDALGQGATVKSFATEAHEERRLGKAFKPWAQAQYRSWLSSIPADVGRMMLAAVTITILLLLTARMYQDNSISIATVALVQLYVIRMITATQDIAELIKTYETTMGGAYQAIKTMLVEPSIKDVAQPKKLPKHDKLDIQFNEVNFHYDGAKNGNRAVVDFSLSIKPGEKIGIVGYSGSGKTTLTKLLLRFMDVSEGAIVIGGKDIREIAQHDLRSAMAYVPQEPLLFHRSIFENIAYGRPEAKRAEVLAAAKAAHVDEFVNDLPNGYETLVGERGVKLSGGQRQRVAIARAILRDAPILVLDEATSALDSRSEKYIQQALWRLMKDRTALIIAHRLSTIQRMDRIVVMDRGKVVQVGTHEELLEQKNGIYAELWAHQSGGYVGIKSNLEKEEVSYE